MGLSSVSPDNSTQPHMTTLILKSVDMKDKGAQAICQMMSSNTNIVKLNCESNTFSHKYLDEMYNACQRNK